MDSIISNITLTNCDREPIHVPGSIQPHGLLLVLAEPEYYITQISENVNKILGVPPSQLLDHRLAEFISADHIDDMQACLDRTFEKTNPLRLSLTLGNGCSFAFKSIVHRASRGEIVLELEPKLEDEESDFFQFYRNVRSILARIQLARDLGDFCDLVVKEIKQITGFDRIMIYRFSENGDGTVIAEDKQPEMEPFMGLSYPDSDIPKQAKHLYTLNWLRLLPDVDCQPARLLTNQSFAPLDMSYCVLRSLSPIHLEYLKNMGVAASMSVSLIQNQQLWGLIACHHNTPKFIPYELRIICEFLGQLISTELVNKEANENISYKIQLKAAQVRLVDSLLSKSSFLDALSSSLEDLINLTGAEGAVICEGDRFVFSGETPSKEDTISLLEWLQDRFESNLFATDSLPSLYPSAKAYKDIASGLLAISFPHNPHRYILWFRPELLQIVTWAGNPDKPKRVEADGSLTIYPRQSFEAWQQTVRLKSQPWLQHEIEGALELRQADEFGTASRELIEVSRELDSFSYIAYHDLKEPLRGIHNYATFLLEDYGAILNEDGTEKLHTLSRLTKRMELLINELLRFSRLSKQKIEMCPIDLNSLLQEIQDTSDLSFQGQKIAIHIPKPLPVIWGDRALIGEVFTNLISNAAKYNDQPEKWVEIGCHQQTPSTVTLYTRDNGIGIRTQHLELIFRIFKRLHPTGRYGSGTGAGLTIARKIIERHGGSISVESTVKKGSTFFFSLPCDESNT